MPGLAITEDSADERGSWEMGDDMVIWSDCTSFDDDLRSSSACEALLVVTALVFEGVCRMLAFVCYWVFF